MPAWTQTSCKKEQGVLIARQKAATAVDSDAHAASVRTIENIQAHSQRMANARQLADATSEGMALGNSLGGAHAELLPQDREAIEKRASNSKLLWGAARLMLR